MSDLSNLIERIKALDPVEREMVLSLAGADLAVGSSGVHGQMAVACPGIVKTPGVCGGSARIIRTRIPVWTLERMRQLGLTEAEILRSYPTLRAIDLVQAWSYAEAHRGEIEQDIRENEE